MILEIDECSFRRRASTATDNETAEPSDRVVGGHVALFWDEPKHYIRAVGTPACPGRIGSGCERVFKVTTGGRFLVTFGYKMHNSFERWGDICPSRQLTINLHCRRRPCAVPNCRRIRDQICARVEKLGAGGGQRGTATVGTRKQCVYAPYLEIADDLFTYATRILTRLHEKEALNLTAHVKRVLLRVWPLRPHAGSDGENVQDQRLEVLADERSARFKLTQVEKLSPDSIMLRSRIRARSRVTIHHTANNARARADIKWRVKFQRTAPKIAAEG
ncbi:hypothetical protein EVAR_87028_1 [Eumeta japonica]|uniref:Uncharacterized protein n=1 Tax=Eumeta variegata TaxID=151549 RepID=A0A4C1YZJ2_EUMVA|nr:hypothetical protein EVAR_87028_1 [Eumeta japonica]